MGVKIEKYTLANARIQQLKLPADSMILSIEVEGVDNIVMWVMQQENAPEYGRVPIYMAGGGYAPAFGALDKWQFLSTIHVRGSTYHVFIDKAAGE